MRSLAWTKHLLFPELSTVADCTVEAVGCLQYSSHQFLPCLFLLFSIFWIEVKLKNRFLLFFSVYWLAGLAKV